MLSLYSVLFEMINSAFEITHDRFGCEYNEETKKVKEIAGAVTATSRIPLIVLSISVFLRNLKK